MARILYVLVMLWIVGVSRMEAQPTKPSARGEYAYLEIMHERQSPDLCLPTCVAMAMNYYGDGQTQWTVKRLSNEHKDLFSGTTLLEVQQGIRPLGYIWDRWQWPSDSIGFQNAVNAVEQSLDDNRPVILGVLVQYFTLGGSRQAGHALLAFGYDKKEQEIFVMDPAREFPGKRYIKLDELREMWRRDGRYQALFTARLGEVPTGHPASVR